MKVDISRAGLRGSPHNDLIVSIESLPRELRPPHVVGRPRPRGFRVVFEGGAANELRNVRDLCSSLDIEPERLRAAVEAEGYEIDGHEIRRIRLPGMDEKGSIPNHAMKVEYLRRVRDWQWIRDGYQTDWSDFCGTPEGWPVSDAAVWPLWRPKSYGTSEGTGVLQSVHGGECDKPEDAPLVTDEERQKIFEASLLIPEEGVSDIHIWTVEKALGIKQGCARGQIEWFKLQSLRQVAKIFRFAQSYGRMYRASSSPVEPVEPVEPIERVERTSEGQITAPSESKNAETTWQRLEVQYREGKAQVVKADPDPNPYGRIALDLAALVADKQRQYGDSAGRTGAILRVLYPDGVPPDAYDRALLVVRVLDKLSRLATNKTDLGGESPWRDVAGYALLAIEKGF